MLSTIHFCAQYDVLANVDACLIYCDQLDIILSCLYMKVYLPL